MRRAAVIALVLAGCGSDPTCFLDDTIVERAGNQELDDCGKADATATMDTLQAIHDCAVADVAAETPFRTELDIHQPNDEIAYVYLGITEGGEWRGFHFAYSATPGTTERGITTYQCNAITDKQPCDLTELRASLCLGCDGAAGVATCIAQ